MLIASIVNSDSSAVGMLLLYLIAAVIGASFGLLFQRDVRGSGSSICWGLAYGLFWWFLGPLTLMPILLGHAVTWPMQAADLLLPSLLGHVIYGTATGLVFFWLESHHAA